MTGRILVVDDVEQNIKLLEAKLTLEYYTVYSAMSGQEALDKVKTYAPDVILLDVMMPEMDGFEVCRRLKADPETAHIPVVMVTALSEQKDRVEGLSAGATDFVTKPIDEVHLFARVKSLIRLKMMLDELRMRDKTGEEFGLAAKVASVTEQPSSGHILVVNDDHVEASRMQKILQDAGNNVMQASDAAAALQHTSKGVFDMVILNAVLDDADGLRLGMEILAQEANRHLPVMVVVDEDERSLIVKALDIGIDDYITSPIDPNELVARCRTQIIRKHFQDALKAQYHENISAAVVDSLTGLYNRRYLDAHVKNIVADAQSRQSPLSLMTIDIDHFKQVNDHPGWGHDVGDEVLQEVAKRITDSVRGTDLATRPGGEEFVVLMPKTPGNIAEMVAERMRQKIGREAISISAEPGKVTVTVSIGVSKLDLDGVDSAQELIKRSDEALYQAKHTGRNRVVMFGQVSKAEVEAGANADW